MSNQVTLSVETMALVIQQYFAGSRSEHAIDKVERMVACFAEDCISQDPAEGPALQGQSELRYFFQSIVDLFSTLELTEEFVSINGNEAAIKWRGNGIGKNGCKVSFEGIDLLEFNSDGKIQRLRGYWSPAAMLDKLLNPGQE